MKKVIFFGIYDGDYSRAKVLREGLVSQGFVIEECCITPTENNRILKFFQLFKKLFLIRSSEKNTPVIVMFPGHTVAWIAFLVWNRHLVFFDAFVFAWDSNIADRKIASKKSFSSLFYYLSDWYTLKLSKHIIVDTIENKSYAVSRFNIPPDNICVVYVSSVNSWKEWSLSASKNIIHFHGSYVPLQGIEYVVRSIPFVRKTFPNILFRLIGSGQEYKKIREIVASEDISGLDFLPKVAFDELGSFLNESCLSLGIFGTTPKAGRVIPNKLYEAISIGVPVITEDSKAVREVLKDREEVMLCPPGDPEGLAHAIVEALSNDALRSKLSKNCLRAFQDRLSPKHVVLCLCDELEKSTAR